MATSTRAPAATPSPRKKAVKVETTARPRKAPGTAPAPGKKAQTVDPSARSLQVQIDRLLACSRLERGRGATEAEIKAAEKALGFKLRGQYRLFLKQVGWVKQPFLVYGLGTRLPAHLHLVDQWQSLQGDPVDDHLLAISDDGCGDYECLKIYDRSEEPATVFLDHELGGKAQRSATSFAAWVRKRLDLHEEIEEQEKAALEAKRVARNARRARSKE